MRISSAGDSRTRTRAETIRVANGYSSRFGSPRRNKPAKAGACPIARKTPIATSREPAGSVIGALLEMGVGTESANQIFCELERIARRFDPPDGEPRGRARALR